MEGKLEDKAQWLSVFAGGTCTVRLQQRALQADRRGVPHPGVPLVEGLDVDKGHFPIGSGHDTIVLTADNQVDVVSELPPAVPAMQNKLKGSPETLDIRHVALYRVRSAQTLPVTYRYATEAISFLSISSSTNGFGLGKLYLSFPCKDDRGVTLPTRHQTCNFANSLPRLGPWSP